MFRNLLAVLVLCVGPFPALAQPLTPLTTASGVGGFGGGTRPNTPALTAPNVSPFGPFSPFSPFSPRFGPCYGLSGGILPSCSWPGFPFSGVWLGGFGFGYPSLVPVVPVVPVAPVLPVPTPLPLPVAAANRPPAGPPVLISNEFPAVLVLEFPAAAELWLNGVKAEGGPQTEWTLTSPVLRPGGEYTFEVKARWSVADKTFEYRRSFSVAGGRRSRALVLAGTEVRD